MRSLAHDGCGKWSCMKEQAVGRSGAWDRAQGSSEWLVDRGCAASLREADRQGRGSAGPAADGSWEAGSCVLVNALQQVLQRHPGSQLLSKAFEPFLHPCL